MTRSCGTVYLVGGGPGDPGLITVRGLSLLRRADVVIHDRLIGRELLCEVKPGTEVMNVGKAPGDHKIAQQQIFETLIDRARRGCMVVRLKGGDPFVFGRGFEEFSACRDAGIDCVVVPGVSSAIAAPTAAGISLTQRKHVRSLAVVTATSAGECQAPGIDFNALVKIDTVVIMMGREKLSDVAGALMAAGRDPATPAACIQSATNPDQRVVAASLDRIAERADSEGLRAPVVTVVGEVAAAAVDRESLRGGPLAGLRVVVTRPRNLTCGVRSALTALGARVIACPVIRIADPPDMVPLDRAIQQLDQYRWCVFTSAQAVRMLWERLLAAGKDARAFGACKIAAIGPATALALRKRGMIADIVPDDHSAVGLLSALGGGNDLRGARVLLPCSSIARPGLKEGLHDAGAEIDVVVAYQTVPSEPPQESVRLLHDGVDAILFCSPSALRAFTKLSLPVSGAIIACIGPTTAQAAIDAGLSPDVVATRHTSEGLVESLVEHVTKTGALK